MDRFREDMNYKDFISKRKNLLIAPAGYGKTYSIAKCIENAPDDQTQLILTHTHAGSASLKAKIKELGVNSSKFNIETITGYAQKYVISFYNSKNIPPQDDKKYFSIILEKAIELFKLDSVKRIIKCSYGGLFVDEYQDCSKKQHEMIMLMAEILPTHIFGDEMQGIFDFNEEVVNFNNDLKDFEITKLEIPWRWKKSGNNKVLGESIKKIRDILESDDKKLDISVYPGISFVKIKEQDIYNNNSYYRQQLYRLINNKDNLPELENLLILVPDNYTNSNLNSRIRLKSSIDFFNQLTLLEAIDEESHYKICKDIDCIIENSNKNEDKQKIKTLKENVLMELFNKTEIKKWIKETDELVKRKEPNIYKYLQLQDYVNDYINDTTLQKMFVIINFFANEIKAKSKRTVLLQSVLRAINYAIEENITSYESMVHQKNKLRRVGRNLHKKGLGTTLLTKGLEFDTVVILNAHLFKSYKHFYVAISRACKKLIVFSEKPVLSFKTE
ncbi:MAG: UvrD-helicase domain-containing protein [Erysipelotrichaceae bacterium]